MEWKKSEVADDAIRLAALGARFGAVRSSSPFEARYLNLYPFSLSPIFESDLPSAAALEPSPKIVTGVPDDSIFLIV